MSHQDFQKKATQSREVAVGWFGVRKAKEAFSVHPRAFLRGLIQLLPFALRGYHAPLSDGLRVKGNTKRLHRP